MSTTLGSVLEEYAPSAATDAKHPLSGSGGSSYSSSRQFANERVKTPKLIDILDLPCEDVLDVPTALWKGEEVEEQYGTESAYENKKEHPYHRLVALLKASALTNVEVAERTGKSVATINYLVKQPFMERMILEEIQRSGRKGIFAVLEGAGRKAAEKLVEILEENDAEKVSAETQRKTANDVLNRLLGLPKATVDVNTRDLNSMSDAELAAIAQGATGRPSN